METALRAALRVDLPEAEFWGLTPYNLTLRIHEVTRRRIEGHLYSGWFAERFAREKELRGPQAYVTEFLDAPAGADIGAAMAEAELTRMALAWGLEVEDLSDEGADE